LIQAGPRNAKVMLVGEAPGATEDANGIPFSGGAGEVLNRMLARAGIDRSQCFITNVAHIRPPGNEFSWLVKPKPKPELLRGLIQLKADLASIRPNLVIALGTWPLKFLTGKDGIDKWRGSILPCILEPGIKVIGTYHPAAVLRTWEYKAVAEMDLAKAKHHSEFPELRYPEYDFYLNPSREAYLPLHPQLLAAPELSVDIETWETEQGWKLACIGFADSRKRAVVLTFDEEWQRQAIRELLASPSKKIFQNGGHFDKPVLEANGYPVNNFYWDTMVGHHARYPECAGGADEESALRGKKKTSALKKGLAFQVSVYTDQPFYKDDGKLWKHTGDLEMFWRYNALDAACTKWIADEQRIQLAEFGSLGIAYEAIAHMDAFAQITKRGIKIDMEWRKHLQEEYYKQVANLQAALDKLAGGPVNVKSSPQMIDLLYNKAKLPVKRSKKTGNPTTDKDAINALAGKYNHPILAIILEIRQRRDFIERYLEAKVDRDGYMRCVLDVTGTRTFRLSSRQSISGSGTNLQNIPSRRPEGQAIRRMFIPDPGMVFIYRDFSQAEARVVAYLARCDRLIELFDDPNRDIHTENASRIFGIPTSEVTFEQRYLAKKVVHACNYGMGPGKLVEIVAEDAAYTGIRITLKKAEELIAKYFMLYPEIRTHFWREVENQMRATRTLTTPFGCKREFFGRWDDKLLREAYSYIPQSIVGWLGRKSLFDIYQQLEVKEGKAQALLNVHDSVLVQCKEADVEYVARRMDELMTIPIDIHGRRLVIPTDCKVGYNWQDRPKKDPESNPRGLVDIHKWLEEHNGS
jgi:uracil-DNA glycosylase family 4